MCIICVSQAGIRQPSLEQIKTMFSHNMHGAGHMVARNGRVHIHKGYMDADYFAAAVEVEHFTASDSVVYHFRVSTQAGVSPEMTHPFPLSDQLSAMKALHVECACGIVHNGTIQLTYDPQQHEYLTAAAGENIDPKTLQSMAGHADHQVTMNVYVHPKKENVAKAGRMMDALLGSYADAS